MANFVILVILMNFVILVIFYEVCDFRVFTDLGIWVNFGEFFYDFNELNPFSGNFRSYLKFAYFCWCCWNAKQKNLRPTGASGERPLKEI